MQRLECRDIKLTTACEQLEQVNSLLLEFLRELSKNILNIDHLKLSTPMNELVQNNIKLCLKFWGAGLYSSMKKQYTRKSLYLPTLNILNLLKTTSTIALFMCISLVLLLLPLHSTVATHLPTLLMMQLSSFSLVSTWMIFLTNYLCTVLCVCTVS